MLQAIDARAARQWAVAALAALGQAREEIDALNVFPVPDGDTGTNLYLTVEAAVDAVNALPAQAAVREVISAFAHGALMGARGNSGVIAAQLMRGWAEVLAEREVLDGPAAKEAVRRADEQAWRAVADPVEGTILSVSRAGAEAAQRAADTLPQVIGAVVGAARDALARTPEQLETLRRAGVVDAGGRGYLVLLETLDDLVQRRSPRPRRTGRAAAPLPIPELAGGDLRADGSGYEVMYLLEAPDEAVATLRARLARLGESLVVVGGDGLWHVHVHADDPGAAIEAGIEAGRPSQLRVMHVADQLSERRVARADAGTPPRVGAGDVALVACAAGPGLARLFEDAGATVVPAGPTRPSTGRLLEAIRLARGRGSAVVVLPNDEDVRAVAEAAAAAARAERIQVSVLPTRAQVQGLAAAAVHDPGRRVDDDVVRMSSAAGATRDGAVTVAVREVITMAGVCRPGDVLGIVQGDIAVVGEAVDGVAVEVLERLLSGGGELVSLVLGEGAPPSLPGRLRELLRRNHPGLDVVVVDGGQPRYPLLVGVE